ncbi:MAG: methyl-accepting chemotaxis protein [Myxococcota bacterium]
MASSTSLMSRVVGLVVFSSLIFAVALGWMIWRIREELFAEHDTGPRVAVEAAMSQIAPFVELERRGALTRADAQRQALEVVKRQRFDGDNYVWVNDLHPTMVMHPMKPELDGKDLSAFADPKGKRLFVEMAEVARRAGAGRVDYLWPKPGHQEPVPKASWVVLQREWGWVVGAGVYTDDVATQVMRVVAWPIVVGTCFVLLSTLVGWWLARRLSTPLQLSVRSLRTAADEVRRASAAVASIAQSLATGASSSAAAVQQSTTAMADVSARTDRNATGATDAQGLATRAVTDASGANQSIGRTAREMAELAERGRRVGAIVKTINEIAFQTNLLALNAAVEASRAGDAGKGFAVVAEEVRALALRSADAARDTAELIESTVKGINASSESVGRARQDFERVGEGVSKVGQLVSGIAGASREQASQLRELGTGLTEIDRATQRTAASAEEISSAAEELSGQADALNHVVQEIDELVEGARRAA